MSDFSFIPPTSVVSIPGTHSSAAFTPKTSEVFKEEHNIAPIIINDKMKYIPWGGDFMRDNDLASYCKVAHLGATAEGCVKQTTLYDNLAKKFA